MMQGLSPSTQLLLLLLLLCFSCVVLFCHDDRSGHIIVWAQHDHPSSATLELKTGLNFSLYHMLTSPHAPPVIPAFNDSYFLPIISSPSFNSSNSSLSPPGFSFGFWFEWWNGVEILLALCGGLSGNNQNLSVETGDIAGLQDGVLNVTASVVRDGYIAAPVWLANLTSVTSANASLQVVDVAANASNVKSKQLQLVDYDGTVFWSVSNVELLEIGDSGVLTIYNTPTKTHAIWQSSRDTLFVGEKLGVGSQLTSRGSTYTARVEQGGLVLRSDAFHFMDQWPAPYWAIPAILNPDDDILNVSAKVLSPPCHPNSTYVEVLPLVNVDVSPAGNFCILAVAPGPCLRANASFLYASIYSDEQSRECGPLSFLKLETDGRLVMYATSHLVQDAERNVSTVTIFSSPSPLAYHMYMQDEVYGSVTIMSIFSSCALPNACGPLGVCAASARGSWYCSCPLAPPDQIPSFVLTDPSNPAKGCKRSKPLPPCTHDEHVSTTDYFEIKHTASIFLFSGWDFHPISGKDKKFCMQSCSSNCSCNGFFYQVNKSSCFFFSNDISLINVTDFNGIPGEPYIEALNYVTYVKKARLPVDSYINPSGQLKSTLVRKRESNLTIIAAISSIVVILGLGFIGYLLKKRSRLRVSKQARLRDSKQEEEDLRDVLPLLPTRFSFEDLHLATKGFNKLIGAGGCGSVYAGTLSDGRKVAVKTLEMTLKGHSKEFLAEVATIGQTNHHNIVRLVGFCWEVSRRLLVYEYTERGSLDQWLFLKDININIDGSRNVDEVGAPMLDWQTRYNVILGIARGLSYLHEECSQPILHFDIKPQNILLDNAFVAKLADFGMSKLLKRDVSQVVTGVRGTPGYIAPEWLSQGVVSKKCDVFSLGMVMLEIIGGRKNVDLQMLNLATSSTTHGGDHNEGSDNVVDAWYFPSWVAIKCEQGLMMEVVDKRLKELFNVEEVQRFIYTAFWCIQEDPRVRPYAPTMVQWLEGNPWPQKPPLSTAIRTLYRKNTPFINSTSTSISNSFFLHAR